MQGRACGKLRRGQITHTVHTEDIYTVIVNTAYCVVQFVLCIINVISLVIKFCFLSCINYIKILDMLLSDTVPTEMHYRCLKMTSKLNLLCPIVVLSYSRIAILSVVWYCS